MKKVLYPGSFDPITNGHMNIINQACDLFDEIVIAIMYNPAKKNRFFSLEERIEIINEVYKDNPKVRVVSSDGATVDLALREGCSTIIRGLRSMNDYDYEVQMAHVNKEISDGKVNTVCFLADNDYQFISSSIVKEVFSLNKDISRYVPNVVEEKMNAKK